MDLWLAERTVLWAMRSARGQRLHGNESSGDDVVLILDIGNILDDGGRGNLDR